VFTGRDQAGLAAAAAAVSDPAGPVYGHYLSLAVTSDDGFVVSAMGTAARAEAALEAGLALSHPWRDLRTIARHDRREPLTDKRHQDVERIGDGRSVPQVDTDLFHDPGRLHDAPAGTAGSKICPRL
jgi:hypothetical protein